MRARCAEGIAADAEGRRSDARVMRGRMVIRVPCLNFSDSKDLRIWR